MDISYRFISTVVLPLSLSSKVLAKRPNTADQTFQTTQNTVVCSNTLKQFDGSIKQNILLTSILWFGQMVKHCVWQENFKCLTNNVWSLGQDMKTIDLFKETWVGRDIFLENGSRIEKGNPLHGQRPESQSFQERYCSKFYFKFTYNGSWSERKDSSPSLSGQGSI